MRPTDALDDPPAPGADRLVDPGDASDKRLKHSKPTQCVNLAANDLLGTEFRGKLKVTIHQRDATPGAAEQHGGKRSAEAAANDHDIRSAQRYTCRALDRDAHRY